MKDHKQRIGFRLHLAAVVGEVVELSSVFEIDLPIFFDPLSVVLYP